MADLTAGFLLATGVLAALVRARDTGEGELVDVSLLAAAMAVQLQDLVWLANEAAARVANGGSRAPRRACRRDRRRARDEPVLPLLRGVRRLRRRRVSQPRAATGFLALFGLEDATIDAPDLVPDDPARSPRRRSSRRSSRALSPSGRSPSGSRMLESAGVPCGPVQQREAIARTRRWSRRASSASLAAGARRARPARAVRSGRRRGARCGRGARARCRHRVRPRGARVRFEVSDELTLFAESVRAAIGDWARRSSRSSGAGRTTATTSSRRAFPPRAGRSCGRRGAPRRSRGGRHRARAGSGARQPPRRGDARRSALRRGRARHARDAPSLAVPLRGGGLGLGPPSPKRDPSRRSTAPARFASTSRRRPARAGRGGGVLACVERGDARVPRGSRRRARSSSPSSTRVPGSSSARRSRRSLPSSPASRMPRSPGRHHPARLGCCLERRRAPGAGAALRGKRLLRRRRLVAPGARRGRLRSRDRPSRLPSARPLDARLGNRRLRRRPLSQSSEPHSGDRTCSMAQSSHSMRDSVERIPPSRAIR